MEQKTFASALAFLASRNRQRSTKIVENNLPKAILPSGDFAGLGKPSVLGMRNWLRQLGYKDGDINSLNIIHVAGTKGKGSTCAYIESLLRAHANITGFPRKTGLYTSPQLWSVTERIRTNFEPISEVAFARCVFEVRDALHLDREHQGDGPGYLQLLAIISFHHFLQEGVDVAIYETHHGGEWCATNVIPNPVITAITSIGVDHINDLGREVEDIAWHKAGILKPGAAAFTVPQIDKVRPVLQYRAAEKGVSLHIVQPDPRLPGQFSSRVQQLNCSLARAVADAFLRKMSPGGLSHYLSIHEIIDGIRQFDWPGRFEIIRKDDCTWFMDVAHDEIAVAEAVSWFEENSLNSSTTHVARVLIFAHKPTAKRDADGVLRKLAQSLRTPFQTVVFTTHYNPSQATLTEQDRQAPEHYSQIWREMTSQDDSTVFQAATISQAIDIARTESVRGCNRHILVTGCHEVVAGALHEIRR